MEIIELRTADSHRNIEWPTTLESFLEDARLAGHEVAKLHGIERWLVFNAQTMVWCEVGRTAVPKTP